MPQRDYVAMNDDAVVSAISDVKRSLQGSVTILGHHYQRDEVIRFADHRGDSLQLSRVAASTDTPFIVFCGVYFMAETAAILCSEDQTVVQPVPEALCPMARMANAEYVGEAWDALYDVYDGDLVPITYQNSIAELKAFVGRNGGAVCTSSNAEQLFRWGYERHGHLLFTPDEHLGTNTAVQMGIPQDSVGAWDSARSPRAADFEGKKLVVWRGFCYVHTGFTAEDVHRARAEHKDARVIVHPECPREVVALADESGSTAGIVRAVENAPLGSTIVVGTECNLVHRLDREHADKRVLPLSERTCRTMSMTRMRDLLYVLDCIRDGQPENTVSVPSETASWARVALERMLEAG